MPLVLFFVFIVVPATELWFFIQVQAQIGFLWALLLVVAAAFLGVYVWRVAGRRGRIAFRQARAGVAPSGREAADVGLLWLAGALLFFPGFLTDIAGLALLLPPVRALVRGTLGRRLSRRVVIMRGYGGTVGGPAGGPAGGTVGRDVVPGEIVREDQVPPDRPAIDP
jgi:UPF0716 protein FxsA